MLDRLMWRSTQWKIVLIVLAAFSAWLVFLAWSHVNWALLLSYLLLEAILVFALSLQMLQKAQTAFKVWERQLNEALDPSAIQAAMAKDPKLAQTLEGRNLLSLALRLSARPREGCALNAQALQMHARASQRIILYYNRAWLLLDAGETQEGEVCLQQATQLWNKLPLRARQRLTPPPFSHVEMELNYRKGVCGEAAYIAFLEDALLKEPMTLCARMLIRQRLARLYHQQGDDQRAYEQLAWLDRFGARCALPKQTRAFLEGEGKV